MQEFLSQRLRLQEFCTQKGIPIPTFRRWKREWDDTQRQARLAALPEKPLAWMPPENLAGYKEDSPTRDGILTMMADLADNLGPHTDQALHITLCCDGLVVSGKLIGAHEYFDGMRDAILQGASELLDKYKREAVQVLEKLLPDTERLPERREEWDEFYEPDDFRDAPDYIHLADVTIYSLGSTSQPRFWRGRLGSVTSFWME